MRHTLQKLNTRLMALAMAAMLLLCAVPTAHAEGESGTCGDSLSWSLSAGTLTITGSGAMTDFAESTMAPWYGLREEILRLVLPEGLTSVGDLAFYGCENVTAVAIPDSVTRIGAYAFSGCTGMELLSIGSGVSEIGEAAFSDCVSLAALRLPSGLRTIGMKAFYRCEAITTVTVPESVTKLGISAFGYCKSLVSANVRASVQTVPEYLFYGCDRLVTVTLPDGMSGISDFAFRGCDQLSSVYYGGSSLSAEEIQDLINDDVPGFDGTGYVTESGSSGEAASGSSRDNGDGTVTQENTTTTETDNSTVSTKIENTHPEDSTGGDFDAEITVTVETEEGWEEAREAVEEALESVNSGAATTGGELGKVDVNVYVKGSDTIDQGFVDAMTGREVNVTIVTQDGSQWRMEGTQLENGGGSGEYDLSYTLSAGSGELSAELGTGTSFGLQFRNPAQVNAEVLIHLGSSWALQNATLFQREDEELINVQTVVVDKDGYAHFYLASVDEKTEYYIAMNLPSQDDAIVPDELLADFGTPVRYTPIEYEITGRTSSWGMTFGQVTWIMAGVLVACVVIVGFVMFALNKRRLKMGYVPDLSEEDYE